MFTSSDLLIACSPDQLIDEGSKVQRGTLVIEIKLLMIHKADAVLDVFKCD